MKLKSHPTNELCGRLSLVERSLDYIWFQVCYVVQVVTRISHLNLKLHCKETPAFLVIVLTIVSQAISFDQISRPDDSFDPVHRYKGLQYDSDSSDSSDYSREVQGLASGLMDLRTGPRVRVCISFMAAVWSVKVDYFPIYWTPVLIWIDNTLLTHFKCQPPFIFLGVSDAFKV